MNIYILWFILPVRLWFSWVYVPIKIHDFFVADEYEFWNFKKFLDQSNLYVISNCLRIKKNLITVITFFTGYWCCNWQFSATHVQNIDNGQLKLVEKFLLPKFSIKKMLNWSTKWYISELTLFLSNLGFTQMNTNFVKSFFSQCWLKDIMAEPDPISRFPAAELKICKYGIAVLLLENLMLIRSFHWQTRNTTIHFPSIMFRSCKTRLPNIYIRIYIQIYFYKFVFYLSFIMFTFRKTNFMYLNWNRKRIFVSLWRFKRLNCSSS